MKKGNTVMNIKMPMSEVFAIVFSGLAIVFIALIILIILVSLMSRALKNQNMQNADTKKTITPVLNAPKPVIEDGISDEVVAVISAAIAAMMSESGEAKYSIRTIKAAHSGRPIWSLAGLQENTRPF